MDQRRSLLPLELLPGVDSHSMLVHLLYLTWELSFDHEAIVLLRPSVSMDDLVTPWRYYTTARLVSQFCTKGFILVELTSDGVWRSLQLRIIFVELWIITDTIDGTWYRIRIILELTLDQSTRGTGDLRTASGVLLAEEKRVRECWNISLSSGCTNLTILFLRLLRDLAIENTAPGAAILINFINFVVRSSSTSR